MLTPGAQVAGTIEFNSKDDIRITQFIGKIGPRTGALAQQFCELVFFVKYDFDCWGLQAIFISWIAWKLILPSAEFLCYQIFQKRILYIGGWS
jgi:hypothetical protein